MPTKKPIKKTKKTAKKVKSPPKSTKAVNISDIKRESHVPKKATPKTPVPSTPPELPISIQAKPKRSRRRLILISLVTLGLLTIFGGVWVYISNQPNDSETKKHLAKVTIFQPYYFADSKIPEGLSLKSELTNYQGGILFMTLKTEDRDTLTITQQEVPPTFFESAPKGSKQITTSYGTAGVSLLESQTVATLVAEHDGQKTFIIINAEPETGLDYIREVIKSLQPFEP